MSTSEEKEKEVEKLIEEYEKWEESFTNAIENDETLKKVIYEEIKKATRYARASEVSFDEYTDMLSDVAEKVRKYFKEKHGIELQDCYVTIDAYPRYAKDFKREIEKNKPVSSVRLWVRCIIPLPEKYESEFSPLELEIDAPLFFVYEKPKGRWHITLAFPPEEPSDIKVEVVPAF